jgi:hypothetical protein
LYQPYPDRRKNLPTGTPANPKKRNRNDLFITNHTQFIQILPYHVSIFYYNDPKVLLLNNDQRSLRKLSQRYLELPIYS